ncbi:auxilin-related protein 2-like [Cucurbita pepo subsp. pepo]|uniref:auxilin-related protein 2-like n=1 Tax=Cucurbita pepo subsp. pepo TaxID=3664 RepID=UPI000C9D4807|nr:auxilin-related protein 2-like [Cucurbita pepo subsp. pepo]
MNDFEGLLATNYGFKPQGKAAPMAAPKGTSNINATTSPNFDLGSRGSFRSTKASNSLSGSLADDHDSLHRSMSAHENREFGGLDDLLGGSAKFSRKSENRGGDSDVNFDSLFHGAGNSGQPAASSSPVYDKPVYDDDIFDGIPGLRSSSKVQYDDVFSSMSSPPKADSAFDDLLGGFGKSEGVSKSTGGKGTQSKDKEIPAFDDLIPGFRSRSPPGDRSTSGASWSSEPTSVKSKTSSKPMENPFGTSKEHSDPHEEASDIGNFKSPKFDGYPSSDANNKAFDDMDPFASLGKSVPAFSSEGSNRDMARSPPRVDRNAAGPQNSNSKETVEKQSGRTSGQPLKKDVSAKNDRQDDQPMFDIPTVSSNSHKFMPQSTSPPASKDENVMGDTSRFEDNVEPDEIWLTVSEIPLFTQPSVAPPPSRPPPPIPQQVPKEGMGLSGSRSSKMNANDFSSFPNSTHHFRIPKPASASMGDQVSSIDELEEFAMGRNQSNADEQVNGLSSEELEMNSAAAAMKEAMDRAEAKFKHAKEVRERESTRTSRSKEAVYWDREEKGMRNERVEDEESLDHERFQREREREEKEKEKRRVEKERERTRELEKEREEREKEQRRLEKERERARELEMERIKVRQAVERATREARERAATEARLKAERAAVEKANAEARERAERTAVQRAQAEARERAAAEARERAERAAAEAREKAEKAAAEAKEREARERASVARAEAEARSRAERAAVERAAAEARERAAVDARDRAAAAARASQQKAENDLESFFSMGRASSAPRPRANPMDNFFDAQPPSRPASETTKPSSATSSNLRKASSATNIVDDLSAIFGGPPSSGEFQEVDGESEERRRARLERHQRVQSRAAKALAEKNERDLQMQREQAERHRISETLDSEIKRWAAGKEGNLRALLSTLQYVLWPECGWQPVSLTEMVIPNAVKKAYRKATLCIHPDKVQQKGATLQQKYVAEKVFDILKEAWNKFNSEELF